MWVGGDINNSEGQNGGSNRTVGFARFTPRDVTPPATPSGLSIENKDGKDVLTWTAVAEANVKYQIIRDNRVIATTSEPTYSVDHQSGANYFVRAIDGLENYSASTAAVAAVEPEPVPSATPTEEASPEATDFASPSAEPSDSASAEPTAELSETVSASAEATPEPVASAEPTSQTLISSGDTWSYRLADSKAGNAWNTLSAVTTDWVEGVSPLGWSSFGKGTSIDRGGSYPMAFYVRKTVEVANPSQAQSLTISTYADDGIVVYVNGMEVTRSNITTSRLAYYSMADWWVDTAQAVKKPVTVEVPASSLVAGQNVIAVEVHGASLFSTNISFDLSATLNK